MMHEEDIIQDIEQNDIICELKLILEKLYPSMVERATDGIQLNLSDSVKYLISVKPLI
jgi:hypothetical protein